MKKNTDRFVPEVSAELAEVLGRDQRAHQIRETWEGVRVYPDPLGCLAHRASGFVQWRLVAEERHSFQPLTGKAPVIVIG